MFNVFEKYAPKYRRLVRDYARHVWLNTVTEKIKLVFDEQIFKFQSKYKKSLINFYKREGIKIFSGTIENKSIQWLADQQALISNIHTIAADKKDNIKLSLVEQMENMTGADKDRVRQVIDDLYLSPDQQKNQSVYKVFSFGKHLRKKSDQLGEQEAFEFGADINNAVISESYGAYEWNTQGDNRVRKTHRKLNHKTFLFIDPPTTIDKYGHTHTGNPGTDYGCLLPSMKMTFDSNIVVCFRRFYSGKLATIIANNGELLHTTFNHPVFTQRGWTPANEIKPGDYVFKITDEMCQRSKRYVYDNKSSASKIFNSFLLQCPIERVYGIASDFHDDGMINQEINVIRSNRVLCRKRKIISGEELIKLCFAIAYKCTVFFIESSHSRSLFGFKRFYMPYHFAISIFRKLLFFFKRQFIHAYGISLRYIAYLNARFYQSSTNALAIDIKNFRTLQFTDTAAIKAYKFFIINNFSIVRVHKNITSHYAGFVYNFETESNRYYINGMSSHNCRCYATPSKRKPLRNYVAKA